MKGLIDILKNEQGSQACLIEFCLIVFFVLIAGIMAVPEFLSMKEVRRLTCLVAAAHDEMELQDSACTFNERDYPILTEDGKEIMAFGNLKIHLPTNPRFIRSQEGVVFRQDFPEYFVHQQGEQISIPGNWFASTTLSEQPDKVNIVITDSIMAPIVLVSFGLVILSLVIIAGQIPVRSGVFMILTVFVLLYDVEHKEKIEIPKTGGEAIVSDLYFGRVYSPEVIGDIKAMIPLGARKRVILVYLDEGEYRSKELFSFKEEGLGAISILHRALFPESDVRERGRAHLRAFDNQ